ncbi:DUF2752 domain-containing protein [Aureitalea marina]|uniref:DUF2752 domain-containing protein n=1 Tax=Aureitalea marina TaxID=930804 RepID=A0A2S7KST4_9FLAO|nr:DUF2752 domain-containing protein [Aureitalea marina]PQB05603.1 hypothetical protein BST85_12370 [Aureitalea marina]
MKNRFGTLALIGAGITGLASLYYWIDPEKTTLLPCPFYFITGFHCPGCGSQRALHHLLHGDLEIAFWTNPLLILSLMIAVPIVFTRLFNYLSNKASIREGVKSNKVTYASLAVVVLFWIGRNIPAYPFNLLSPDVFP